MAVRQRGKSWQGDVVHKGQRIRKNFDTEAQASAWESATKLRIENGEDVSDLFSKGGDEQCKTMGELLERTNERHWVGAKAEQSSYANGLDVVGMLGKTTSPASVNEQAIDTVVKTCKARNLSDSTINRKLAALSRMLHLAHSRGWIKRLPEIERKKECESRVKFYTKDEEKELVRLFNHYGRTAMADLVVFLADTGLRLGEALGNPRSSNRGLVWEDTEDDYIRVWVSKGGSPRSVPQSDRVKELLVRRRKEAKEAVAYAVKHQLPVPDTSKVFWDLKYFAANDQWEYVRQKMEKQDDPQWVIHSLRHTFCSRLVQEGVGLLTVKELAGHKSIQMTMRYAHLHNAQHVAAIAALTRRGLTPSGPAKVSQTENCANVPEIPVSRFINQVGNA